MTAAREIIWVTGASSGIGEAIVRHYASEHRHKSIKIIASARNERVLIEKFLCYEQVYCLPIDVTSETKMQEAAKKIGDEFGYVTHVYVNAGHCEYVDTLPMDTQLFSQLLSVNVLGAVNTLNAALPLLEKSPVKGVVVGMCSQVVFAPFSRAEFYGASKAAFAYLMKSLRLDLAPKNIDVCLVYPGFVKTPLTDKNDFAMPFLQTAEQAARIILKAVKKRKRQVIFPKRLYILLRLSDYFPRLWQKIMLAQPVVNRKG